MKFDSIRAIGYVADELRLLSRNANDITRAWPELAGLAPVHPGIVVDGEIVVFGHNGVPSFSALQPRIHQRNHAAVAALAAAAPATYVIFDLLHIGNRSLIGLPYRQRRELLEQIGLQGPHWRISPRLRGRGADLLAESARLGVEGLVCKHLDCRYLPEQRSPDWTKLKNVRHQEVVIAGWSPGTGVRAGRIGSLAVAVPDPHGNLVYAGHVGTGFSAAALASLYTRLRPLHRISPVLGHARAGPGVVWVVPELVGEVAFTEWTSENRLRHPSWRGLRPDTPLADQPAGSGELNGFGVIG
ncbi:non-homologous end-joining DNA ligase [Nocardia sp. NPDC051832]|uniref:non-homologous end-joining DNA ligase n=1 Tax=Nocardia sp. NPDC051832 TaxID=3155673 RepID=UPI003448543D